MSKFVLVVLLGSAAAFAVPVQARSCGGHGGGHSHSGESYADVKLLERFNAAPVVGEADKSTSAKLDAPCAAAATGGAAPPLPAQSPTALDAKGLTSEACSRHP